MDGFGIGKYKKYIDDLTAILDASSEIIFLCNNFDITRIQDLFINIIENYNYYEEGKNDTSQTERLGGEISGSAEYIKMKKYIDTNFKNIEEKCKCFTTKLEDFRIHNLPDIDDTQDSDDALIRDNFKSQYKTIRINLEDIERELSKIKKITEPEITAIKDDDIQFNIFPITKSNMMYTSSLYSSFKMIFKNLQIINSNENEITEEELEEINNDLKKLYINLIEKFNHDTIDAQEKKLKNIIVDLNNEEISLKEKYDSYIKKGGDVKGKEGKEGDGEGDGEGVAEGREGNVEGNVEGKDIDEEGKGENVKKLEENAERLTKEADEAKKKADELNELANIAKLKKGNDEEENLKLTKEALDAAIAAHDAAKVASDAKNAADEANLAAAEAAKKDAERKAEEAKKKAKEAEEAKKKAAEAAKKKAEEAKKKTEEAEEAKKKDKEAKKMTEEDPLVLNFEYYSNSCYVNSVLQMLIDNEKLCVEIVKAANDKKLQERFNIDALTEKEKISDEYLLYLLYKIIQYHRIDKHPIGEPKKPSYNEYILPLRYYLIKSNISYDFGEFGDCASTFEDIIYILNKFNIGNNYSIFPISFERKDDANTSLDILIGKEVINSKDDNIVINIVRSQPTKDKDDNVILTGNGKVVNVSSKRVITLPQVLNITDTQYKLKGFIHFIDNGHFVYYKFLNNAESEWVLLDDFDTHTTPPNINDKVSGDPLGKNGKRIKEGNLPKDGSVLIYYKKDDTALNASPIGAIAKKDDPDLQAAQPVAVAANTTTTDFKYKYSFEKVEGLVDGNTPIYNGINQPYYSNSKKDKNANFMASLNAGDAGMYIGGSAINHGFAINIEKDRYDVNGNKLPTINDLYLSAAKMHLLCYLHMYDIYSYDIEINSSTFKTEGGGVSLAKYFQEINVKEQTESKAGQLQKFDTIIKSNTFKEVYLYISSTKRDNKVKFGNDLYPGDVFIDVFKDNIDILNNKANRAMIYCVGPDGSLKGVSEDIFLATLNIVGENIANAINEYNKYDGNINKKLDYVRICLISGNLFLPQSMKKNGSPIPEKQELVAEALIKGIHSVNSNSKKEGNYNIVYNFAYANGVFQKAFDKLKANDPVLASAELIIT